MADGDFSRRAEPFGSEETIALELALDSLSERLRSVKAKERENANLSSDLSAARNVQSCLLPARTAAIQGLDIHSAYRPAREVGGDYYDFLPLDSRRMGLVVADVSGKSVPAALIMSTTRAMLRAVAPDNPSAAQVLSQVNAMLAADIPKGMFVTACYMIIDPKGRSLLCASAGHTPLLVGRRDGRVEQVAPGGIALGFDPGPVFQRSLREARLELEAGDRILAYTDGVVECQNPAKEEYSDRRLREFLRRNRALSSRDFVESLLADLDRHRGESEIHDDTTIVTFTLAE
jgi:sigma-B regulation protein RsbU (phosphoserine phosphatase)